MSDPRPAASGAEIELLDVVRLAVGLPEHGIPAGEQATILEMHGDPPAAYEIEVVDEAGYPRYLGPIAATDVELVRELRPSHDSHDG